jgi:hypothetical protein
LICPGQLGNELLVPGNGATALGTCAVFEELTPHADVMPPQNLFIGGCGHAGGHMLGHSPSKVPDLLKE